MPEGESLEARMVAAQRGDRAAYRVLLRDATVLLRAYFRQRVPNGADVEDLVQDTLLAAHAKLATCDAGRGVAPWLYGIARYKCADHWRRAGRAPPMALLDENLAVAPPVDDSAADIAALLARLPAAQAEALLLTKIEGCTAPEAARRAGIGNSAMKLRVHRALKKLRAMVAESADEHR